MVYILILLGLFFLFLGIILLSHNFFKMSEKHKKLIAELMDTNEKLKEAERRIFQYESMLKDKNKPKDITSSKIDVKDKPDRLQQEKHPDTKNPDIKSLLSIIDEEKKPDVEKE